MNFLAGEHPRNGNFQFEIADANVEVLELRVQSHDPNVQEVSFVDKNNLETVDPLEDHIYSPSASCDINFQEDSFIDNENLETEDTPEDPTYSPSASTADANVDHKKNARKRRVNEINEATPVKIRKLQPSRWKATKAKEAHNSGVAYVSQRGKSVEARSMGLGRGVRHLPRDCTPDNILLGITRDNKG